MSSAVAESPFKTKLLIPHASHLSIHSIDSNSGLLKAQGNYTSNDLTNDYSSPMKLFRPNPWKDLSQSNSRPLSETSKKKQPESLKDQIKRQEIAVLEELENGNLEEAKKIMENCMKIIKKVYTVYDLENIYSMYLYADVLARGGDIDIAIHYSEKALHTIEELPPHIGKESQVIQYQAMILYMVGLLYINSSQPCKGIHALQILSSVLENYQIESISMVTVKLTLGNAYIQTQKFVEAQRVFDICRQTYSSDDPMYHQILIKMLQCAMSLNQLNTVEGYLNEAKQYIELYDDTDKYMILSSVAWFHTHKEEYPQAIEYLIKCMEHLKSTDQEFSNEMGWVLTELGNCYIFINQLNDAFDITCYAKIVLEKSVGPHSKEVANAVQQLGNIKFKQHELQESIQLYKLSKSIFIDALGPVHDSTIQVCLCILHAYLQIGNSSAAWEVLRELNAQEYLYPPETAGLVYNEMGNVMRECGYFSQALQYYESALRGYSMLEENNPDLGKVHFNIGSLNLQIGRISEATLHLSKAKTIKEACFGKNSIEIVSLLEKFAEVYKAQGRTKDAYEVLKKALKICIENKSNKDKEIRKEISNLRNHRNK